MKVYIGPYKNWVGPYQLVDMVFFWHARYPDAGVSQRWDYRLKDAFQEWLADTWVSPFCEWVHKQRKQKVRVKLHRYDTWNMDTTLAHIILPMLKQLKKDKHGSPYVADEDVPEYLRSTAAPKKENEWDTDDNFFLRWDWVMNEMIWAFEQHLDPNEEDKFWLEKPELDMEKYPEDEGQTDIPLRFKKDGKYDDANSKIHYERKDNAFRLFGKYYTNLWD